MKLVRLVSCLVIYSLSHVNILAFSSLQLDIKDYSSIDSIRMYKQTYPKKALEFGFDLLKSFSEDEELTLEFVNTNYYIGETFYHLGDYVSSYEYLKKSLELYELLNKRKRRNRKVSKPPWILTVMGAVYYKNKDYDNAIKFYNEAIENFLLFDPLEMVDTSFYLPKSKLERLTTVYIYDSKKESLHRAPNEGTYDSQGHYFKGPKKSFSGGAGLLSTSSDYGNFLSMILNQGKFKDHKILSRKSIELITRDNLNGINYPWGDGLSFGLGVAVTIDSGAMSLIGSDGQIIGGGAYRTEFWVDPKEDLIVIFLTQVRDEDYDLKYHEKLRALIYQSLI
jgi:tetratricopeptide (TPR) repeat protein